MKFNDKRVISISTAVIAVMTCLTFFYKSSDRTSEDSQNLKSITVDKKSNVLQDQSKPMVQQKVRSFKKSDTQGTLETAPLKAINPINNPKSDPNLNFVTPSFLPFQKIEIVSEGSNLTTPNKFPLVAILAIEWGGTIKIGFSGKKKLVQSSETVTVVSKSMSCDFSFGMVNSGASSVKVKTFCDQL